MTDLESSYTYGVLKRAIAEIDRSGGQITLSDAASMGMSAPISSGYFQNGSAFHQEISTIFDT